MGPSLDLRKNYWAIATACAVFLAVSFPRPLLAQTASEITPKSFAPPVQGEVGHGFSLGATPGLDTPPGAERLFVTLSGVDVEGGFPALSGEVEAVRAKLVGKRVSGADIFAAARALEAAYAKAGYVLVRVLLPPQKLDDGAELKLRVVDGYISRIDTARLPPRIRARINRLVKPLEGVRGLTLGVIERQILLASDVPGVALRSTLAPGPRTGETILVLNATYRPATFDLGGDNALSSALGGYQLSSGVNFNSLLGLGEQVYLRLGGNLAGGDDGIVAEHPLDRSLAGGFIVPIGPDGLTFNSEITEARNTPKAAAGAQSTDTFDRFSLRLRYAWLRSRNADFASQLVFDAQSETQGLIAPIQAGLFEDRLRVLRLTQEGDAVMPWGGVASGAFNTSFGIGGLGARLASQADAALPLSRQGASASFTKIDGNIDYDQPLATHLAISLALRGQYVLGGVAMEHAEQIGIAGPDGLSAFDAGTLQGDSGFVARAEASTPFPAPALLTPPSARGSAVAAPYLFVAGGQISLNDPTSVERGRTDAGAYGVGLRLSGLSTNAQSRQFLSLEFSRQVRGGSAPDDNRFSISGSLNF
jgi:hemolysin activation/secretion protein